MKLTGMKSAKIDITNELVTIAADDGPYVVLSSGITGTQLKSQYLTCQQKHGKVLYGIEVKDGMESTTRTSSLLRTWLVASLHLQKMVKLSGSVFSKVNFHCLEWKLKPKTVHQHLKKTA